MVSFFTTTVLIGIFTAGSLLVRFNLSHTDETVEYSNGRIEKVTVSKGSSYYCPYSCRINHRHQAHDHAWACGLDRNCNHFVVRYGPTEEFEHEMPDEYAAANETFAPGPLADQSVPNQ